MHLLALVAVVLAARMPTIPVTGYAKPQPVYTLMLGQGNASAIRRPKKIIRAVSGHPDIVQVLPFGKATPVVGIRAKRAGVTNVLVWTTDSQVHTYRITVK